MSFGQNIKNLRHNAEMTQERLAELLSISPQAVSRWETDIAMPDISLLPPLANLFGVTTDFLLGMDTYQKDLRKAEFDKAFERYWECGDKEKNYQIALQAATEYPGKMEYVQWLADNEYYLSFLRPDPNDCRQLLESSVKHYQTVLDNAADPALLDNALSGIVFSLCMLGRNADAKGYAMKHKNRDKRDKLLAGCLEGEEKVKHNQTVAERLLDDFLDQLRQTPSLDTCDAVEGILKTLFPDQNYQRYHNTLQYICLDRAFILCRQQRYDEALQSLQKARSHALAMDRYDQQTSFCFTAPLFHRVSGEKAASDSPQSNFDDFVRCLNTHPYFAPIREQNDFQSLLVR